ncbi:protein of unknown function [Mariniphaga anaerophila]|uniref:DUF4270 domain-containing protein n=1 Tax=Mariniphaga anaerophila TaxID=1484053 RepID=A0A1M5CGN6_9BACT|nr:DUF4270 domain-containing protein [Mariniphaga anaerophila]SHF53866.1 protein of unknown function [Mariniphaga anaerophila]
MKRKTTFKYHLIIWGIAAMAFLSACNDPNDLGMELLPTKDLVEVKNLVDKNSISSYTFTEGPIRSDEGSKSLLGSFYDPVFGKTNIDFAAHFRMQGAIDYGTNTVVDSVKLFLYYRLMYGDTITSQKFRVYELMEPIFADTINETNGGSYDYPYYQDVDLKQLASTQLLGEVDYTPVVRLDSTYQDTVFQLISIPLDKSLGEKLVNADPSEIINNDTFLEYFKGLLIEAEAKTAVGGSILVLEAASSSSFQGSALLVYYDNDENQAKEKPDTLLYNPYIITGLSARVNSIEHDYSGTAFEANLNVETGDDSLIYVQSTGGLESKIYIEGLSSWKDSTNIGINKAELVFQVDTLASEVDKYPPPAQLLFTVLDEDGNETLPADYSFSSSYYGGVLRSDYTYRFNITQHLEEIISGKAVNNGFFLTTARKNSEANRVVLKGSNSTTGIKLVITYSKFLQ